MLRGRSSLRSVGAVAVCVLALSACGGDGDDDGSNGERGDRPASTASSTTQPGAQDEEAVRPYVESLLGAWDEAMTDILADPRPVAADPDHELAAELAESFTADSPYVADLTELLEGYVAQDTGLRPGPRGVVQHTTLLEFTQAPDDDQVSFVFCSFADGVQFRLSSGEELPPSVGVTQGAGDAVRVDGVWLLHRLRRLGLETKPGGTPDPCPALVASGEDGS
jgi:hypothetical protein